MTAENVRKKVTFQQVEKALRKRNLGALCTISEKGRSHLTLVMYAVSPPNLPLKIYVCTGTITLKARDILAKPNISFLVPLTRRFPLNGIPPPYIQFYGTAKILKDTDEAAIHAFHLSSSRIVRGGPKMVYDIVARTGGEVCFICITPDPLIHTYGLGFSLLEFMKHIEQTSAKVKVPSVSTIKSNDKLPMIPSKATNFRGD